jgi:hypothetical protein
MTRKTLFREQSLARRPLEWRQSPEGQQFAELADALRDLMEDVQLDATQRQFILPDGERLDLDQSVVHIQKQITPLSP